MGNDFNFGNIVIHAINVNSIIKKSRRHTLQLHLSEYKPDIVLLSETCLSNFHRVLFSNYNIIRSDKELGRRDTAILIK